MAPKEEYLEYYIENSDLVFELQIMNALEKCSCVCDHGGRYLDVFMGKMREYDILAKPSNKSIGEGGSTSYFSHLELIVECKNISDDCPILVGMRHSQYQFIDTLRIMKIQGEQPRSYRSNINLQKMPSLAELFGRHFLSCVGVDVMQVARGGNDRKLKSVDRSGVHDKWSQSLAHSLYRYNCAIKSVLEDSSRSESSIWCCPVLVVPDGRLFGITHSGGVSDIENIDGIPVRVGYEFDVPNTTGQAASISHYFLFTETGLRKFVELFK